MKLCIVIVLLFQSFFLYCDFPEGIDENRLAGLFSVAVMGICNEDPSVPEPFYTDISDHLLHGIERLGRFKTKSYMSLTLSPSRIPLLCAYMKNKRLAEAVSRCNGDHVSEKKGDGRDFFETVKEMSIREIRETFGEEVAGLLEKARGGDRDITDNGERMPGDEYERLFYEFPEQMCETIMKEQYLLIPHVGGFSTESNMSREKNKILDEDEEGNKKRIFQTMITLRSTSQFTVTVFILDTRKGEVVMKDTRLIEYTNEISRDFRREAGEDRGDKAGSPLGNILKNLLDIDDDEDAEDKQEREIRRELRSKKNILEAETRSGAAVACGTYLYTLLSTASVFHIDTTIVKAAGGIVYLNKGRKWDIGEGDEFLIGGGTVDEVFIRVKKSEPMYSIGQVIWGKMDENAVATPCNRAHVNIEGRAGMYTVEGLDVYSACSLYYATGGDFPYKREYQVWPYFSLWLDVEIGYSFIVALDFGGGFSPYEKNTWFIDGTTGLGLRFFLGRVTLEAYTLAGAMIFFNERQYSSLNAASLGLSPPGSDDILLTMTSLNCFVKPTIGASYMFSPFLSMNLKADYRYNFYNGFLSVERKEVSADSAYHTDIIEGNPLFSLDGITVTLSMMMRF
ncbi:MAG: hypothetical protein JW881_10085 [Spirochaetales bacterium]|nr:hypothetical protein [Spirochaetales bacterium]